MTRVQSKLICVSQTTNIYLSHISCCRLFVPFYLGVFIQNYVYSLSIISLFYFSYIFLLTFTFIIHYLLFIY